MTSMSRSKEKIDKITQDVNAGIEENVKKVKEALGSAGDEMKKLGKSIEKELLQVGRDTETQSEEDLKKTDDFLRDYGEYRYYLGLAISSLLLLILICVVCGLLCGICGKRPAGYDDDCCNKGAGGRFLMM